ncbi:MAG: hypothetical protein R3C44_19070 [Chloroflexota bacterium]
MAHPSMVIEGTIGEWEMWTGMSFPESGDYIVEGALVPIQIDREVNIGVISNRMCGSTIRLQRRG